MAADNKHHLGFKPDTRPLEKTVSATRQTLQHLKPLLEDRGRKIAASQYVNVLQLNKKSDLEFNNSKLNVPCIGRNSKNVVDVSDLKERGDLDSTSRHPKAMFTSGCSGISSGKSMVGSDKRGAGYRGRLGLCGVTIGDGLGGFSYGPRCLVRVWAAIVAVVLASSLLDMAAMNGVECRSAELPRYETAYACEGKTLKIGCPEGAVIHLIRANYGRFSITICNDHGNTDWSVNCMSTRSLRVLHTRCSMNQNCSILASTNVFGDPCPNTLKYLEAHYQCVPGVSGSTTSTTFRPTPPWLVTSQPSVWRSSTAGARPPRPAGSVVTPPTFRPHITLPPELKPGDVSKGKTTVKQPEVAVVSKDDIRPSHDVEKKPETKETKQASEAEIPATRNDKPQTKLRDDENREVITEDTSWPQNGPSVEKESGQSSQSATDTKHRDSPSQQPYDDRNNDNDHQYQPDNASGTIDVNTGVSYPVSPAPPAHAYCRPVAARGLHWNWTLAGSIAVQPCPGGATGLARWRCTIPLPTSEQIMPDGTEVMGTRRGPGALQSGENFADLGLEQPARRQSQLMRRLSGDSLLIGRDGSPPADLVESEETGDYHDVHHHGLLPDAQASSVNPINVINREYTYESTPTWLPETPDLSECRSVWLNSLEARVREGESLLSICNDLAQVTSSKTLYGGDMMTTTNIMKRLAQRMALNVQTFPDTRQREAIVTDMLLGVVKTGSNLLDESQRASWKDLSHAAQMRVATSLLIGLEENAFLLAEAVLREKTILQQVKNILLSVRVLETKNVEEETFPSAIAREQWTATEDVIALPRAALLENSESGLVRIVFVAFDRLEEILQPMPVEPQPSQPTSSVNQLNSEGASTAATVLNAERTKQNVTRVVNSKIISASLGKGRHIQLSQMVKLTLKHLKTENVSNPTCVFWDYTVNIWSSEGCQVDWSNGTHTGCSCAHLTNFAILMDLHGARLGAGHELALRLVTMIGCAVSCVALVAAIVVFQCFRNMKSDRVTIHKNLCICLLIAEIIFMYGIDQTQNRVLCGVIAGLLHYFFLAAFAWMFLEGFQLYAMLVEVFEPELPRARYYYAVAYSAPALVVLASAAADPKGYGTQRHCWLSNENMFVMSFIGPVAVVLMANWVCLSMVVYMMCHHSNVSTKSKENTKFYKTKVWVKSSAVLAVVLGLTWTLGLLYLAEPTAPVAYAFTVLNSLQGFFIFLFHCLQNEMFQKECARLGRRYPWLSCCLSLAGQHSSLSGPGPHNNAPTASSSNNAAVGSSDTVRGSIKNRRYQQSGVLDDSGDMLDAREGVTNYKIQGDGARSWQVVRPTAPIYMPSEDITSRSSPVPAQHGYARTPTPQNVSHSHSIASMHSYSQNQGRNLQVLDGNHSDYQNTNALTRSRSPSCFSNKMAASGDANSWGLVANPISAGGGSALSNWKNTSSKHYHQGGTSTLPHHDTHCVTRQMSQPSHHGYDCDGALKDEASPLQHQGYQTTRSYNHPDFRNPQVYMAHHSPGSQEMIFRKHEGRRSKHGHHHHHGSQNINHTYSEIASQQGGSRIQYSRGSDQEFRIVHDDPVYEEIERNETLMSDMSDDNSGPEGCIRQSDLSSMGHHSSTGSKFYGDHRPLISYSPGERHHHEQSPMDHYGKYGGGKWDSLDRSYDPRHGMGHAYHHQPQESNMRALAAVLNGENNVVCHLEPHSGHVNSYDVYQPQTGGSRTVSQPSF